MADQKMLA